MRGDHRQRAPPRVRPPGPGFPAAAGPRRCRSWGPTGARYSCLAIRCRAACARVRPLATPAHDRWWSSTSTVPRPAIACDPGVRARRSSCLRARSRRRWLAVLDVDLRRLARCSTRRARGLSGLQPRLPPVEASGDRPGEAYSAWARSVGIAGATSSRPLLVPSAGHGEKRRAPAFRRAPCTRARRAACSDPHRDREGLAAPVGSARRGVSARVGRHPRAGLPRRLRSLRRPASARGPAAAESAAPRSPGPRSRHSAQPTRRARRATPWSCSSSPSTRRAASDPRVSSRARSRSRPPRAPLRRSFLRRRDAAAGPSRALISRADPVPRLASVSPGLLGSPVPSLPGRMPTRARRRGRSRSPCKVSCPPARPPPCRRPRWP